MFIAIKTPFNHLRLCLTTIQQRKHLCMLTCNIMHLSVRELSKNQPDSYHHLEPYSQPDHTTAT